MDTRSLLLAFAAPTALAFALAPASARAQESDPAETEEVFEFQTEEEAEAEAFQQEMTDAFAIFGELFAAEPLTEEQEARLPLAEKMTAVVMPEGTMAEVMQESMEPMMSVIMQMAEGDARTQLTELTGVSAEDLAELSDEDAQAAIDLLDPLVEERNAKMGEVVVNMVTKMFEAMEPAYGEAIARVFAIRFDEAEMEELLVFFDTPLGGKFARESFRLQYDPQMMGVMEAMGPAFGDAIPDMMEEMAAFEQDYPEGRRFPELSAAEKEQLAGLLDKGVSELESLAPEAVSEDEGTDEEDPFT
ncbi:DUF2059 domain-containing protein [Erythrobacter crassostreae]|uniref:DUF2059 domain-containing protein n=1 Tax=Erythrobacter crassostreae TaxID=2828328 RepID=A0A9X1F431_9SPHN|nr:DUF2059 domain-containing protein [Erythrobacter crassostrea]MBV7258440.1 hypothetical protein [Erythrobacter crassostrea]